MPRRDAETGSHCPEIPVGVWEITARFSKIRSISYLRVMERPEARLFAGRNEPIPLASQSSLNPDQCRDQDVQFPAFDLLDGSDI
jgi:hypothetical protein